MATSDTLNNTHTALAKLNQQLKTLENSALLQMTMTLGEAEMAATAFADGILQVDFSSWDSTQTGLADIQQSIEQLQTSSGVSFDPLISGLAKAQTAVAAGEQCFNDLGQSGAQLESAWDQIALGEINTSTLSQFGGELGDVLSQASASIAALEEGTGIPLGGLVKGIDQAQAMVETGTQAIASFGASADIIQAGWDKLQTAPLSVDSINVVSDGLGALQAELEPLRGKLGPAFDPLLDALGSSQTMLNATADTFKGVDQAISNLGQNWQDALDLQDSAGALINKLQSAPSSVSFSDLAPVISSSSKAVEGLMATVSSLSNTWDSALVVKDSAIATWDSLQQAMGGAKTMMATTKSIAGGLSSTLSTAANITKNFAGSALARLAPLLTVCMSGFMAAAGAAWSLAIAILANPITWIVVGIIALIASIVGLVYYWDELKAAFMESEWGQMIMGVIDGIVNAMSALWDQVSEVIDLFANGFTAIVGFFGGGDDEDEPVSKPVQKAAHTAASVQAPAPLPETVQNASNVVPFKPTAKATRVASLEAGRTEQVSQTGITQQLGQTVSNNQNQQRTVQIGKIETRKEIRPSFIDELLLMEA